MIIPLAEKLRPQNLDQFIGQIHLRDKIKRLLTSNPQNILFFGPPGVGKSTLALILAQQWDLAFIRLSAPETNLSQLRKQVKDKKLLILDEIHRFSKAQQDFFLPLLETGQLTLLATTTENPSFSLTRQLLSRMHVLRLIPLSTAELEQLAKRGLEALSLSLPAEAIEIIIQACAGDGRRLLNLLEYVAQLDLSQCSPEELKLKLPEMIIKGDRDGDVHYDLASAFIKSIRGSDPDAAIYYLACMLESGEDPRFICRRLILSAAEDVGLADPQALNLAVACAQAVETIGMPEGFIPLAETTIYLALAPKSNSAYAAYLAAQKEVRQNGLKPVPLHLRNPNTSLHKKWGYGKGYKYPHIYPEAYVQQQYLPEGLQQRQFYTPKKQGQEAKLNLWLKQIKNISKT